MQVASRLPVPASDPDPMMTPERVSTPEEITERCCEIMLDIQRGEDERKLADTGGRAMDSYHHDVAQFVTYLREHDLSIVDGLDAWIREVKQTCRARTVNRKLAAVRARILGNRSVDGVVDRLEEQIPVNVRHRIESSLRKIKGVKVNTNQVKHNRIATYDTEIPALLEGITEPVVALVVEFMAHTGCRINEVLTAEIRNCERESTKHVAVTILGKGSKERTVHVPTELYARIVDTCGSTKWLFEHDWHGERRAYNTRSMSTRIGNWTERILGRRLSAHAFRHSNATYLIRVKGLDIKRVSQHLGHSSVAITSDIYDHVATTPEDVEVSIG